MGESQREKAAERLYGQISSTPTNILNRFQGYESPFSYKDMSGSLDDIFQQYEDLIQRDTSDLIAETQQDAVSKGAMDLMNLFNQLDLNKTKAATDVDLANIENRFKKFGIQSQLIQELDDSTFWDDLFAGISTIASIATAPFR